MKTEDQVKQELEFLTEYCKRNAVVNSSRSWMEGRIFTLLWLLGTPPEDAILKSHELTNPVKAVCPPPAV